MVSVISRKLARMLLRELVFEELVERLTHGGGDAISTPPLYPRVRRPPPRVTTILQIGRIQIADSRRPALLTSALAHFELSFCLLPSNFLL
jgi:hypothetical protein